MRYCVANVGMTDPTYGGVLTDISTLPVGTTFFVNNGAWYGRIVDVNGERLVQTSSTPLAPSETPRHRKPSPMFPAGSDDNILALSDVRIPETARVDGPRGETRDAAPSGASNKQKEE